MGCCPTPVGLCPCGLLSYGLLSYTLDAQLQGENAKAVLTSGHHPQLELGATTTMKFKYRGLVRTVYVISAEEGVRSLYGGLVAALQRQLIFASIRLGYYDKVKQIYIENIYGPFELINLTAL